MPTTAHALRAPTEDRDAEAAAELVVAGFDAPNDAERALGKLSRSREVRAADLRDAVVAARYRDGSVRICQCVDLVGSSAASNAAFGACWAGLIGLLLLQPMLGVALGGALGAGIGLLSGKALVYGIDDDFVRSLADTLPAGSSALFVLVLKARPDALLAELSRLGARVLRSPLSAAQQRRLRRALRANE